MDGICLGRDYVRRPSHQRDSARSHHPPDQFPASSSVLLLRRASLAHERGPALVLDPLCPLVVDGMHAEALNHFMSSRLPFGSPPRL
ncbi:hypothetical protein HETIRDRAFT_170636 [Heterobasidion irregulare TC 32-1]|uniref:Uncharacterized protein n=1 Tax=Heterobasidion irregulare (strain TC 32-1) TaxID=747525 RepID=W4KFQ9_HETIT|nr:uncharacterized protein HETIRDRAFT_170636 [Heterobasidion irregulare TC 32-1]ETW84150.1 hypothetical protein HETIRDRAFT_170636 [Heterobasidion irregulare TC 32-1]